MLHHKATSAAAGPISNCNNINNDTNRPTKRQPRMINQTDVSLKQAAQLFPLSGLVIGCAAVDFVGSRCCSNSSRRDDSPLLPLRNTAKWSCCLTETLSSHPSDLRRQYWRRLHRDNNKSLALFDKIPNSKIF